MGLRVRGSADHGAELGRPDRHVDAKARRLWFALCDLAREFPAVLRGVRGAGLLLGLECVVPNGQVQAALAEQGLLSVSAGDNVVRLAPPLVLTDADIDAALGMIRAGLRACRPDAQVAAK